MNKDESYALGSAGITASSAALWNLSSKELVAWVPANAAGTPPQRQLLWDKNSNDVYWYTSGMELFRVEIDFLSQPITASAELWDSFPEFETITFGSGEGDFSDDGSKLVLVGKHSNSDNHTIISYQVATKDKSTANNVYSLLPDENSPQLDWAGVDPTGEYIVINQVNSGHQKTWVLPFDQTQENLRILYQHAKHSDFVVDSNNQPWIVFGTWQGLFASKLSAPLFKQVWPKSIYFSNPEAIQKAIINTDIIESASGHASRVADIPGLVLVSKNSDGGLYFINIDEPGRTRYIGNTRHGKRPANDPLPRNAWGVNTDGRPTRFLREPRGSASPSGNYVFFVSDYHIHGTSYNTSPAPEFKAHLNMIALNSKLVATDDGPVTIIEDITQDITVLGNDIYPDDGLLSVTVTTAPVHGTATANEDKTIRYKPDADYHGEDNFVYTILNNDGRVSAATVGINVTAVNDAPVVTIPIADQAHVDAETLNIDVSTHFSDPDGDILDYSVNELPAGLAIDSATGVISGVTDKAASQGGAGGSYTVVIMAEDTSGSAVSNSFDWTIVNPAPIAANDGIINVVEDSTQFIHVINNDTDPDGDRLTITAITTPAHGVATISADSTIQYTPDADTMVPIALHTRSLMAKVA